MNFHSAIEFTNRIFQSIIYNKKFKCFNLARMRNPTQNKENERFNCLRIGNKNILVKFSTHVAYLSLDKMNNP